MIPVIVFILSLTSKASIAESTLESVSSGDGDIFASSTSAFTLINDEGDIANISTVNSSFTELNLENDANSTIVSTNHTIETTTQPPTTTTSTVETTTQTTTLPTTTTTEETTTTTLQTTTIPTTSTTTTMAPTTTVTTTTEEISTTVPASSSTQEVSSTPENSIHPDTTKLSYNSEENECVFTDVNFSCDTEVTCYGEGEIDCEYESDALAGKISISSLSEDDSEQGDSESIATFPPNLVGVLSPKRVPFFFKMGSLGSTEEVSESTSESSEATTAVEATERTTEKIQEVDANDRITEETKTTVPNPTEASVTSESSSFSTSSEIEKTTKGSNHRHSTTRPVTPEEVETTTSPVTDATTPISSLVTEEETSAAIEEDSTKSLVVERKKREDNILSSGSESSSSSMSISLYVAPLKGSKKMRMRTCRLVGNIRCNPQPTVGMCKGKTYCQAFKRTSETSEKSTGAKGVENWAIAVIAICATAAALTVSLLAYLLVTSWKKLKVQPQNDVTTLTYVNSTHP